MSSLSESKLSEAKRAEGKRDPPGDAGGGLRGAALLSRLADYYYEDDRLLERLDAFAQRHCGEFSAKGGDVEFDHRHQQLHAEFCALFEEALERDFLRGAGASAADLFEACRDDAAGTGYDSGSAMSRTLLAAVDFQRFVEVMRDAQRGVGVCNVPPLEDEAGELHFSD